MKKILLSLLIISATNVLFSQEQGEDQQTCYQKYASVFEKRGAYDVADGVYNDVIISFRKGSLAECYFGKVEVKNQKINVHEIYLRFEDDTYEKVTRKFRYPDQAIDVTNGMSRTMITADDELITILFVKKIKPKKKSYSKAPDPDFDF
ncbi:MAG: hypothetical protein CVT95_00800 [Bacteroidetes bacterium HGW-Bacteroidetes-12]|nr:MAG: hypothetical protein CVT95_00800 [Bacteroidetes bacterium HGW-Bacteroidetes-12]